MRLKSFAAFFSSHPLHPEWVVSSQCIFDEALLFLVPSWGPALLTASVVLLNLDFLTRNRKKMKILNIKIIYNRLKSNWLQYDYFSKLFTSSLKYGSTIKTGIPPLKNQEATPYKNLKSSCNKSNKKLCFQERANEKNKLMKSICFFKERQKDKSTVANTQTSGYVPDTFTLISLILASSGARP